MEVVKQVNCRFRFQTLWALTRYCFMYTLRVMPALPERGITGMTMHRLQNQSTSSALKVLFG